MVGLWMGAGSSANAVVFSGSSGTLAASVSFDIVAGNLQVTLANTSTYDTLVPTDVLTAVFFNVAGNPSLTPLSAVLAAGSTVFYDAQGQPAGGVVGGEWAYRNNLPSGGVPLNANSGISSSGFGPPADFGTGAATKFPGADLENPDNIDGLQYGILSAGDNSATGNTGITGSGGLIKNSVVFTLSGLPVGFSLADISGVSFQYGTALSEPNIVPEPSTYVAGALLLIPLLAQFRRWKRAA